MAVAELGQVGGLCVGVQGQGYREMTWELAVNCLALMLRGEAKGQSRDF